MWIDLLRWSIKQTRPSSLTMSLKSYFKERKRDFHRCTKNDKWQNPVLLSCLANQTVSVSVINRFVCEEIDMKNFDVLKMATLGGFLQRKASKCIKRKSNLSFWSWKKEKWFIFGKSKSSFAIEGVQQSNQQSIWRSFCNWKYSYLINDFCWW